MSISKLFSDEGFKKLIQGNSLTAEEKLEYEAWQYAHSTFLAEELAKYHDPAEDVTASRCQVEPDGFDWRHEGATFPYEVRNLKVLVLSNTYEVVREGYRHPDLEGK